MTGAQRGHFERVIAVHGREVVVLDDQCPITSRRCDRPCGAECIRSIFEPNDGPGPDGHHVISGECFACLAGVSTGPESHGDRCPYAACRCDAGSQGSDSLPPGPQHDDDCSRFRPEVAR